MTPAYEHNGAPVSREAFYAIACDPRRSVAVEACAGAGKTWMLVSRIVRALLAGCPAHEILAITFTKKAAGEMRERLHEWLAGFADAAPEVLDAELQARGLHATPELREALRGLQQRVLEAGRPAQIRTFHSWFAALLRSAPLAVLQDLGLPGHYELLEDDSEAVARVWRRFHAALLDDAAARADFELAVATHGRSQTHKALEAALSRRVEFALADAQGVVDASVPPFGALHPALAAFAEPAEAIEAGRERWLDRARALGQESAKTPQKAADAVIDALALPSGARRLAALRKAFFVAGEDRLSQHLRKFEAAQAAEAELQPLCAAQAQHEAWLHQQRLARLTRRLVAEFAALKREQGWVDMNDVERAALVMLADPVLSGWVQQRLDARVRQLLIDEFQDTNPLQWQALHGWLSAYAGAGGGASGADGAPSVFIVGDPKQSIYRFRRAEPQVFLAAQAFVVEGLGGDRLSCDHTRRNAPEVIATVNAAMLAAQDEGAYAGFRAHTTEARAPGAVLALPQIARDAVDAGVPTAEAPTAPASGWRDSLTTPRTLPEDTLKALECRQAAHWLVRHMAEAGLAPRDVMVLSRKRERLGVMQDELRALHVPAQQPEKAELGEAPEVQDVVALLDALVSPTHDLSLARALKSPLFGLGDDDLVAIALAQRAARDEQSALGLDEAPPSWFDLLQSAPQLPEALRQLGPVLRRYQDWLAALPPHDALDAIYHHGDVLARFAIAAPAALRASVLANLRALLSAALQIDGGRYATPYGLVRALKAGGVKAPQTADADAVRLLTVHGAKGLEAPLVLLLDTDAEPPKAETMGVLVDWPGEAAGPQSFLFLASESRPPPSAVAALAVEQAARAREELNGLYVAMTRARSRLVISSVAPHRASEGSAWQRLQGLCAPLEVPPPGAGVNADVPAHAATAAAGEGFSLPVVPEGPALPAGSVAGQTVASRPREPDSDVSRLGQAMHRLLEWAEAPGTVPAAAQVQAAAREFGLEAAQAERAASMAAAILAGDGAWAWSAAEVDWQGSEVALTHRGQFLRLDRLVRRRDDGSWWVLDYKSAAHPERDEALRLQLRTYREAVRSAYPGAAVRAAFLTARGELVALAEQPAGAEAA